MNIEPWRHRANRLARLTRQAASTWGPGTTYPATGILLALMIVGGVVLRIQNVGYPFRYGFDESQWVGAARQFLVGLPDAAECCHPPLAKFLIGVGMLVFGDTPMGWRFMPLCLGIQSIVLVFFIASTLFRDRRAGWMAAAFMAGDGFFLAFSRHAFSEGMMATLVLWSLLAACTARGWGGVLASAMLVGLAASIKWSGVIVALPVCFAILWLRRAPWYSVVSFAIVPVVHLAIWMIGLSLIGQPNDPMSVFSEMRRRQGLHLGFPHGANPAESPWYSWLIIQHPLLLNSTYSGSTARLASACEPLNQCRTTRPRSGGRSSSTWSSTFPAVLTLWTERILPPNCAHRASTRRKTSVCLGMLL